MIDFKQESLFPDISPEPLELQKTIFEEASIQKISPNALKEEEAINTDRYDKLDRLANLANKTQNIELRKDFAYKAYNLASVSIGFWMMIISICMLSSMITGQKEVIFSDTALGIITTGVTVNVFAALLTVVKGLFTKIDE